MSANNQIVWHIKKFHELTPDELYKIMQLRQEVFVMEQNCAYIDADGKDLQSHHLFCLDKNGNINAYARIVAAGVSYKEISFGRIATSSANRGTGLGLQLMDRLISEMEILYGKVGVRISAQSYLKEFYEKFGFEQVSDEYLEDDIPHMEMLRLK